MSNNDHYREYAENRRPAAYAESLFRYFHARALKTSQHLGVKKSPRLLEIGYGFGYLANVATSRKISYASVDMSPQLVAIGRAAGHQVTLGTVPPIPEECLGQFDTIWMSHVLEHAKDWSDAKAMLGACYDALPEEGAICVISPDIMSWKQNFWNVDWSHGYPTSLARVDQLLREVGFKSVQSRHHTLTISNRFFRPFFGAIMLCVPVRLIDAVLKLLTGKTICYSFMTLMGWRQIICVGRK